MGQNEMWPSAVVGGLLLILIGAVTITAIVAYDTVDDALRFWDALAGLAGVVTGAFATYFFTRGSVQQAQQSAQQAQQSAAQTTQAAAQTAATAQTAAQQAQQQAKDSVTEAQKVAQEAQKLADTKDSAAEARLGALTKMMGALDPQVARQFLDDPDIKHALS